MAKRKKPRTLVPHGLYDPALDANLGAARRGYEDLAGKDGLGGGDYTRDFGEGYGGGRTGHDYLLGLEGLDTGHARAGEDFVAQRGDIRRNFVRGREDFSRQLGDVKLGYQRLGRTQAEGARRAGVTSGGLAAKAAQIRAGNLAHDRAPLDTNFRRLGEDSFIGIGRSQQAQARETQDYGVNRGALGLQYQRAGEDARTGLTRAGREQGQFDLDTNAARVFSATQAGWDPGQEDDGQAAFQRHRAGAYAAEQAAAVQARRGGRRARRSGLRGTVGRTRVIAPNW